MSRILIIDDEESMLCALEELFSGEGFEADTALGGEQGLDKIKHSQPPDLLITDIKMPDMDGIEVLRRAKKIDPYLPVVVITARADTQAAINACNEGAYYFLEKPFENNKLLEICLEALEFGKAGRQYSARKRELSSTVLPDYPVGETPIIKELMQRVLRAAETDSTMLIQGESGTGKELIARYIHKSSSRADRPFVTVNCGALPETLLESELFGHVKGSFTGAISNKDGLFKAASGGTIFLDEVGDTSLALQVKLLRVLQMKEITPVGSTEPVSVDVRVIAATNKDLDFEAEAGHFRRDLFYRLNVIPINVPPLRERAEDIPLLIDHFLERNKAGADHKKKFTQAALSLLTAYHWPGNIRELENVIERLIVVGPPNKLTEEDLPEKIRRPPVEAFVQDQPKPTPTLEAIETAYIHWVMEKVGGNKTKAAEILGIDPSTLYRKFSR